MATRGPKKGDGEYPGWLYSTDPKQFNGRNVCLWLCSGCGSPTFAVRTDVKHGTPAGGRQRDEQDPRYVYYQGPCWRARHYKVNCMTPKAWRVLYHEDAPWPDWEVWSRLEAFGRLAAATERTKKAMAKHEARIPEDADAEDGD